MKTKRLLMIFVLVAALALGVSPAYAEDSTEYGTAGSIGEEERNPDAEDHSNWLTIRAGDYGVRIVTQDGMELIAADNHGGVYLNGDVYLNQQQLKQTPEPDYFNIANGFFYLLLVISLGMNLYCVVKIRRHR